jgi:hypothetical protein
MNVNRAARAMQKIGAQGSEQDISELLVSALGEATLVRRIYEFFALARQRGEVHTTLEQSWDANWLNVAGKFKPTQLAKFLLLDPESEQQEPPRGGDGDGNQGAPQERPT